VFPPPGRFLSSIAGLGWLALLALACGGEEVSLDPSPSAAIIEDTKPPQDPSEPQNNEPMYTGPPATPRPCPECFAQPFPKPSPRPPCPQRPLRDAHDVNFASVAAVPTDGWVEYASPNYPFRFKYPPDWKAEINYYDVYGWAGEDGIIDAQQVRGPPTEVIHLYNDTFASAGIYEFEVPQDAVARATGAAYVSIVYGPFRGSSSCEAPENGNPKITSVALAGLPATGTIVIIEPPDTRVTHYVLTMDVDPRDVSNVAFQGYSYADSSNLSIFKAMLNEMTFD